MKIYANENVDGFEDLRSQLDDQTAVERFDAFWLDVPVFDITNQDDVAKAGACCPNFGKHINIVWVVNM